MKIANELKETIQHFETLVAKDLADADAKLERLNSELDLTAKERKSTIAELYKQQKAQLESLEKKCEYLKAEVWRYKHLLEEFSKAKTGPEMDKRIKELEEAINEHAATKIKAHEIRSKKKKEDVENEFMQKLHDLNSKVSLLKDQVESRIDSHIDAYKSYVKNHISILKGTAETDLLVGFDHANYTAYSQSFRIGNIKKNIKTPTSEKELVMPVVLDFQDTSNLIILYDSDTKNKAEGVSDNLIFRALSSNLPDKFSLHLYDKQMFEIFSEFLKLPGKVLKKGSNLESLISEIGALEDQVREKLSLVWSDINDGNQSIHDYNLKKIKQEAFDDIIPYHLFVIDNAQSLFNKSAGMDLLERMNNLTRYGANFVLLFKIGPNDTPEAREFIMSIPSDMFSIVDFTGTKDHGLYKSADFEIKNLQNDHKKQILDKFLVELSEVEKNRSNLKFVQHFEKDKGKWFSQSAGAQVKVPIGKSLKAQGKEHISFNTKNELSHILMVGGIGSGKTNFLKTIITSISIEYNPDEVELYLIDMKSGAGFSVFETEKLPHAKLYVFSAENELIKDVFENLKQEMDRRYAEYSKYNIDNLQDIYKDPSLAPFAPKRKIVIIDEFASIYTDDEMYHDEISSNILNIAQKGRAMGINLFFATQNFNNISSSAFNQAATQFATRIVLKGSPESSSSILGTSNDGFKEVTRIGEGFVNTNYGQINSDGGNHFFKSFLLDNEDLIPLLKEIRETAESRKLCKSESVLIDGAKPADFTTNAELFALQKSADAQNKYRKNGISSYLGEAFLMKEPNHFYFSWKLNGKSAGQNILIAGNEREIAVEAVYSLISSLTHGVPDAEFAIKFINPLDPDYSRDLGMDKLPELLKKYAYEEFGEKDLMFVFEKLQIIIDNRKKSGDRFPIVVIIPALENFVKMHRAGGYDLQPEAALFKELLSNGSNYGIYFICEINKPGNFSKMGIAADFLQHFDHRIAFFMNSEESINMIDSKMANKLVSEDNQNVRNKGLYYNQSSQSCYKFKSYSGLIFHENMIRNLKKEINDLYKLESIAGSDVDPDNKNNSDDLLTDEIGTEDAMMSFLNNINLDDIPEDATITIPETNETSEEENI